MCVLSVALSQNSNAPSATRSRNINIISCCICARTNIDDTINNDLMVDNGVVGKGRRCGVVVVVVLVIVLFVVVGIFDHMIACV